MIARALIRFSKAKVSNWLTSSLQFSFATLPHNYSPPESKLQQFIKCIYQLEDKGSKEKAAQLLGTLEADSEIYADMLKAIQEQYKAYLEEEPQIVKTLKNKKALELSIKTTIEENQAIENRCHRDIENIKVYGVSRIAREIIEIADHLNHALSSLKQNKNSSQKQLQALQQLHHHFYNMLQRYEIYEINPKDEPFDPNNHESLGLVDNEDQARSHTVAQTKRTGWKIRDRLLRHATVLIYK